MKKQFYLLYIGGGFQYGFEAEALGIRLDAVYRINETFRAAFDFTCYFPESNDFYDLKRYEININAHYLFVDNEQMNVYALAGINYAKLSIESNFGPDNPPGIGFAQASQVINKEAQQPVLGANDPFSMAVQMQVTHKPDLTLALEPNINSILVCYLAN